VKKQRKSNVQPPAQTLYIPDNFIRGYIHTMFSSTIPPISLTFYAVALAPVSVIEVTFSISIFGILADALPKSVCLALGFLV
jgi:hypothetical protein